MAVTVADLKALFPEFATVVTQRIQMALDMVSASVSPSGDWGATMSRDEYVMLRACELLATSQAGAAVRKDGTPIQTLYTTRLKEIEARQACMVGRVGISTEPEAECL